MKFKTFLLDQWLQQHADAEFDLGSSTGPRWTARELLELTGDSDGRPRAALSADRRRGDVTTGHRRNAGRSGGASSGLLGGRRGAIPYFLRRHGTRRECHHSLSVFSRSRGGARGAWI